MADFAIDEEIMSRIEADSKGSAEEETPIVSPQVVENKVASDAALDDGIMARIEADTNRENAPLMTTAKDPMQAAREYHAAKRLGRAPVEVEADLDDIERAEKEERIGRQLKDAPHTAAWMAENGASSSALVDKVKDLSRIENLMPMDVSAAAEMQARNEGEEWEFLADLITSTKMNNAQFEMGILYNTLESAEDITPDFKAKVAAITKRIDAYRDQLYDEKGFGSNAGMVLASLPLVRYGGEGATYGAALAALSLAGSAMATVAAPVTGGATLPVAAALGSFATMTASGAIIDSTNRVEQGMQLKNMLDEGVPFEDAMIASQVVGAVNAGLELAGASIVGKTLKPLVRPIMSKVSPAVFGTVKSINPALKQRTIRGAVAATGLAYGKGIAGEVSTEVMQEVASIIADDYGRIVTGKELLSTQEIIDRLAETAIATAKGMMVMGSFGGLALLNHNIRQVHKAEDDKAKLLKMARSVESINKEPLTAEVAKDVVQHQAERKGTPTIYVQASAFEEAMTSEGVELSDLDEIVPGLTQEKLEQLKAQGEDVEIETGAYAQKVIGTTFGDRLADDIRTSKDGISVREAQKVRAESAAILKDLASGKVDEAELDKKIAGIENPEIKEKTNTLAKRIEAKLKETGVYGADVARTNAKYAAWLVSNLARRSGLSFERVAQLAPNVTHAVTQASYANALKEIREAGQGSAEGYIRSLEKKRSMLDENQIKALDEFKEVYARYSNTDAWMKAPNGSHTNLNEVQWVMVRTPAFKAWFGDWENDSANASKVIDENGEPKVVYHRTDSDFSTFDLGRARKEADIPAFFFSDGTSDWEGMGERVMPVFLNLRNPVEKPVVNMHGAEVREQLIERGIDGTITPEEGMETEYAAFYPNQIKSATDNIGTFDLRDANIYHQVISPGITGKSAVKQGLAHDSRYVRVFPDYQDFSRDLQAFMRALFSLSEIPGMKVRAPKLSEEEAKRLTKEEQQALAALNKLEEAVQKTGENAYKAELERLLAEAAKGKDLSKAGEVELRYEIAEENEKHLFSVAKKAEDAYRKENAEKFKDAKKVASIATKARQKASNRLLAIADKMVERMTRNLLFLFDHVSSENRNRARLWYVGANKIAQAWAKDYKLRLRQTSAIIAVFSPKNDWFNNMSQAERTMDIYFFARDHKPDAKMKKKAKELCYVKHKKEELDEDPELSKDASRLKVIQTKTLRELIESGDLRAAAIWVRAYDETHNSSAIYVQTPEGGRGKLARTPKGKVRKVVWASFNPVVNALSILEDGSVGNIDARLGAGFKVRDFYNNILRPDEVRAATIDTHAVGANTLNVMSQKDDAVNINFGAKARSAYTGQRGTYSLHFEAIRRAAEARGVTPREMQSITWEAVRVLFDQNQKESLRPRIAAIWEKFENKQITEEQAREEILAEAGGFGRFAWEDVPENDIPKPTYDKSDIVLKKDVLKDIKQPTPEPSISIEIAPNENPDIYKGSPLSEAEKERAQRVIDDWHKLTPEEQKEINDEILPYMMERIAELLGVRISTPINQLGGWQGEVNHSTVFTFENPQDALRVGLLATYVGDQQSVYLTSSEKAEGLQEQAYLRINVSNLSETQISALYKEILDKITDEDGERVILGMSCRNDVLEAAFDKRKAEVVDKALSALEVTLDWDITRGYSGQVYNPSFRIVENENGKKKVEDAKDFNGRIRQAIRATRDDPELRRTYTPALRADIRARYDEAVRRALSRRRGTGKPALDQDNFSSKQENQEKGQVSSPKGLYQRLYQRAFHGSPFKFDQFTLEHIGSGEGAQAHGWGLYFALSNDTAAKYWGRGDRTAKVTISDPSGTLYSGRVDRVTNFHEGRDSSPVATVFEYSTGNIEDEDEGVMTLPVEWLEENFDVYVSDHEDAYGSDAVVTAAIDWINNWRKNPVPITEEIVLNRGSVYEVEIPEDDVMLREEKLLKDQPQKVQAGIRATIQDIIERYPEAEKAFGDIDEFFKTSTGENFYSVVQSATGSTPEGASRLLNEHGIEGIRYFGKEDGECAVVFDDKAIRILQYWQTAFHGSPYQFERFDFDRIGTGMGATRYGWGIYFAGDRDIAQAYASTFKDRNDERIRRILIMTGTERREDLYGMSKREALRASIDAMLDADLPENIRDAVEAFFADKDAFYAAKWLDEQTRDFIDELTQDELGKPLGELSAEEFRENLEYWMSTYVLDGVGAYDIAFLKDVARNGFSDSNLSAGFVYEAFIPDDDVILDQDLPLDSQPEKVKKAIRDYLKTDDLSGMNGYAFYREVSDRMLRDGSEDPEKDASLLLNSLGILGMRFTQEHGAPCYVVFDDEAIEILTYRERLVEAGLDGGFRGAYNPSTNTVDLTDDADLSTFAHELGHWYLDTIIALSQEAGVSDGIKEDVATLMKEFGVADVNAWKSLSFEDRERFHEQFAAWVETYLAEGKAPTLETKEIFSRFGEWIRHVYRAFTGGAAEGVKERYRQQFGIELPELSDEVRRVLDRMVASEEDIETAQAVNGLLPLFMDKPEGMSDEAWNELQEELDTARNDAIEALTRIRARDERWYTKARAVKLAEIQAQAREIRDAVRVKVEEEVNNTPAVRALNWLMANDKAEKGSQFRTRFKFSLESLKAIKCSESQIAELRRLGLVLNDGGTDIATIRAMLQGIANFESDKDLVTALISASKKDEIIERRTTERCLIEHSDFFDEAKVDAIVTQALHSEARSRVLAHELAWLNNDTPNRSRLYVAAAKEAARQMVGNDRITKVNVKRYLALQTRWARAAREALARGDRRAALQAKRLELVAHEAAKLVIEIDKLRRRVDDIRSRIFGNDKKLAKTYDIDIIHALRFILNANGLGPSKSKTYNIADAIKHIERMQAYAPEVYQRLLPLIVNYGMGEANVRELTTAQVRELFEVVASLYKMARDAKSVLLEGKRLSKEEIVSELVTQLASTKQKPYAPGTERVVSDKERAVYAMLNVKTALMRVENWCNAMDGGRIDGPFKRYIFNPVSKSVAVFKVENNKLQKRLYDLIAPMQKKWSQVRDIKADELGYTFATKEELIAALLHTGNDSNKRKLLLGGRGPNAPWGRLIKLADGTDVLDTSNWDAFIARCISKGIITKEDMDFVQAVWDTLESTKPMAQKAFKAIYGYYFDEVEATPVQTPWGEYRGGYVPAITTKILDPNQGQHEELKDVLDEDTVINAMPVVRPGFTQKREEAYHQPLDLNVGILCGHVQGVVKFAILAPTCMEVAKILNDRAFGDAVAAVNPHIVPHLLTPWLKRAYTQSMGTASNWIGSLLNKLRSLAGMGIMMGHIANGLQQLTGFSVALKEVDGKNLLRAFAQFGTERGSLAMRVKELSPFMKSRLDDFEYEYQSRVEQIAQTNEGFLQAKGVFNKVAAVDRKLDKVRDWVSRHSYFVQVGIQYPIDVVVWTAAFNEALEKGASETDAIAHADFVVRTTQSDFSPENVANVETGHPGFRLFLVFYNYFGMQLNALAESHEIARQKKQYGKFLADAVFVLWIPSVLAAVATQLVTGFDTGDDDDWDIYDFFRLLIGEPFKNVIAMVPYAGSFANTAGAALAKTGDPIARFIWGDDPFVGKPLGSPGVEVLLGAGSALLDIYNYAQDKDVNARSAARHFTDLLAVITRVPVGALKKPLGYLAGVANDEIEVPSSPIQATREFIAGRQIE